MAQLLINISRKQAFIYAFFCVLYEFLTYIANDMIMPGMLKVVTEFHAPETAIATSLTAYILGGASLQLLLGPISDRYGRRPVMIFGAGFFVLCTIFIACSHSIDQFLLARYFQGMGLCFISVVGYATVQEIFAEMDAIRLIAIMANAAVIAPLIGPLLGAIFIYYYSWQLIFVMIGIFALVALWGLWRFMPETVGQMKCDGEQIKPVSLSPRSIAANYKKLLLNPTFILGSMACGLISVPCLAWIALSPVMLVTMAKLSVIQYGLWQVPVFGAYILGNIALHRMTHARSILKLISIGSCIAGFSLLIVFALPYLIGPSFLWLLPGLIVYFFGLGLLSAPLNRFILFSTSVSKGTATALMSMITMCVIGLGIEGANYIYATHNNLLFGLYCGLTAIIYMLCLGGALYMAKRASYE